MILISIIMIHNIIICDCRHDFVLTNYEANKNVKYEYRFDYVHYDLDCIS